MSRPTIRVNTFIQKTDKPHHYIDIISKVFICLQTLPGSVRLLSLFERNIWCRLILISYSLSVHCALLYMVVDVEYFMMRSLYLIQLVFFTTSSYFFRNRLILYYNELHKFDTNVGCTPKVCRLSIQNVVQMFLTCCIHTILIWPTIQQTSIMIILFYTLTSLAYMLEVNYYGHLLNLLTPRLKLINHFIETSLSTSNCKEGPLLDKYTYMKTVKNTKEKQCDMRKMMDLYHIMVDAYNYLIDAIKWQLLISIISSFVSLLCFSYKFALVAIRGEQNVVHGLIRNVTWSIVVMIPLFSPCTFADSVHRQVRKLRELLASRLYENKLDKTGRSVTRALLAFTETRDLSFRLLRMLDIDISLPFKFIGLLITYLIILLQFEKVINPQGV